MTPGKMAAARKEASFDVAVLLVGDSMGAELSSGHTETNCAVLSVDGPRRATAASRNMMKIYPKLSPVDDRFVIFAILYLSFTFFSEHILSDARE